MAILDLFYFLRLNSNHQICPSVIFFDENSNRQPEEGDHGVAYVSEDLMVSQVQYLFRRLFWNASRLAKLLQLPLPLQTEYVAFLLYASLPLVPAPFLA